MGDVPPPLDFAKLAQLLAPHMAYQLALTPTVLGGDGRRLHLGTNVVINNALFNVNSGEIFVGDNTFFGHNVSVITGTHDVRHRGRKRHDFPKSGRDIRIGAGVWLASNTTVLGPCEIGDAAVVAAGAVLLPGTYEGGKVYAGVPARPVKDIDFAPDPVPDGG